MRQKKGKTKLILSKLHLKTCHILFYFDRDGVGNGVRKMNFTDGLELTSQIHCKENELWQTLSEWWAKCSLDSVFDSKEAMQMGRILSQICYVHLAFFVMFTFIRSCSFSIVSPPSAPVSSVTFLPEWSQTKQENNTKLCSEADQARENASESWLNSLMQCPASPFCQLFTERIKAFCRCGFLKRKLDRTAAQVSWGTWPAAGLQRNTGLC